jgi:hypothetical protein
MKNKVEGSTPRPCSSSRAAMTVSSPVIVESRPSSAEEYRETRRLSVCRPR